MATMATAPRLVWWIEEGDTQYKQFHALTLLWIKSLGLDPNWLKPRAAIVQFDGQFELHVDEVVRDPEGRSRFDPLDENSLLAIRKIIHLEQRTWPARPERVAV